MLGKWGAVQMGHPGEGVLERTRQRGPVSGGRGWMLQLRGQLRPYLGGTRQPGPAPLGAPAVGRWGECARCPDPGAVQGPQGHTAGRGAGADVRPDGVSEGRGGAVGGERGAGRCRGGAPGCAPPVSQRWPRTPSGQMHR